MHFPIAFHLSFVLYFSERGNFYLGQGVNEMVNDNGNSEQFVMGVLNRAKQKAGDITNLLHQQKGIVMEIERAKEYLEKLNAFLQAEGHRPVLLTEPRPTTNVGIPGNRSKKKPLRKIEWDGMSLMAIIQNIVDSSPNEAHNAEQTLPKIFEIKSPADRLMVLHDVRSTLQTGSRQGRWDRVGRGLYKSKNTMQQRMPVNV